MSSKKKISPAVDALVGLAASSEPVDPSALVKVTHHGVGAGRLLHGDYSIGSGETVEVPHSIAKVWYGHSQNGEQLVRPAGELPSDRAKSAELGTIKTKLSDAEATIQRLEKLVASLKSGKTSKKKVPPAPAADDVTPPPAGEATT